MPVDVIFYALVAVGLILWLRSLLGMRQDGDRQRPNPFAETDAPARQATGGPRVLTAPPRTATPAASGPSLARHMIVAPEAEKGVSAIEAADKYFNTAEFLQGAQDAFIIVVEAFAAGNRETLSPLLDPTLYDAFAGAIARREQAGEKNTVEIHAIRRVELIEAGLDGKTAYVTVKFVADETTATTNAAGIVTAGNPDRIVEATDIWTFTRQLKARGPEWTLARTREETVADQASLPPPAGSVA